MYLTTFYSFKGGVGRTMALANVAVQLALRGRRILVVDFDIEAPGLDTFDEFRPSHETLGVVDFVNQYLQSAQAPNVANFIGECPAIGNQGGQIWIMPSGKAKTYTSNFGQVDWNELYERYDGYLLFEDLKEQWKRHIEPDYVLIDSRTGYTDISGICTRQLPDSVVIFFFPNEQNLRGLTEVVRDIRSEADEPRKKNIELHFVMSNVPDLDDEDQILESKIKSFQDQLKFHREPMIVHRYDSLSLLNQAVFSKDRPRSRLAKEYGEIVFEISTKNWEDRDGALQYIQRLRRRGWRVSEDSRIEEMLKKIEEAHRNDGNVLFSLAELREADRQPEILELLVTQAIEAGYDQPEAYLKRSRIREESGDPDGAKEDIWRVMHSDQVTPPMIREAIRRLAKLEDPIPEDMVNTTAVVLLEIDEKFWLANTFDHSLNDLSIAILLWKQVLDIADLPANRRAQAEHSLGLSYMGLGRCLDASRMFRDEEAQIDNLGIRDAFNYGMAMWGLHGEIEIEVFQRVVALHRSDAESERGPNYLQCMAVAFWATGDTDKALEYVARAEKAINDSYHPVEFSCWHYLQVPAKTFVEDLEEIRTLIETGKPELPKFAKCTSERLEESNGKVRVRS